MAFDRNIYIQKAREANIPYKEIEYKVKYAENISKKGYPVIFAVNHLALMIGVSYSFLQRIVDNKAFQYSYFILRSKKNDSKREIMIPQDELKYIQKWIDVNILTNLPVHRNCYSYSNSKNVIGNAKVHENKKYLIKLDLLKFFDTVTLERVEGVFRSIGYTSSVSKILANICTMRHRSSYFNCYDEITADTLRHLKNAEVLPQGAPSSPRLSNFVLKNVDYRLSKLCECMGSAYTRYADDICISANDLMEIPNINLVEEIIHEEKFFVNPKKVVKRKRGQRQLVTGLTISDGVHVSKRYRREISKHLFFAHKFGPISHLKKISENVKHNKLFKSELQFKNWLHGSILWIISVDKSHGTKMFKKFNLINWTI